MVTANLESKLANGSLALDTVYIVGGAESVKREPEDLTRRSSSPCESYLVSRRATGGSVILSSGTSIPLVGSSSRLDQATKEELEAQVKEESGDRPRNSTTYVIANPSSLHSIDDKMTSYLPPSYATPSSQYNPYDAQPIYLSPSPQSFNSCSTTLRPATGSFTTSSNTYVEHYDPAPSVPSSEANYIRGGPDYPQSDYERSIAFRAQYKVLNAADSSPDSGTSSDPGREHIMFAPQVSPQNTLQCNISEKI